MLAAADLARLVTVEHRGEDVDRPGARGCGSANDRHHLHDADGET